MEKHTFEVTAKGHSKQKVTVTRKTYAEATDLEKRKAYGRGLAGFVIDIQGGLRKDIAKGLRGAELNAKAQQRWDAVLAGYKLTERPIVDAASAKLTPEQIAYFERQGSHVINKDWAKSATDKPARQK